MQGQYSVWGEALTNLYGDGVDPVALDAQLKGVDPDEPVGTGIDTSHDANEAVIPVEKSSCHAATLPLWHRWSREGVENVGRITTRVETVGSTGLDILSGTCCQSLPKTIQRVRWIVGTACKRQDKQSG